ncbi:hypothetical protein NA57DRAFT_36768 [Rhizodiscina lignyota]|uniref:Zinc/iron permease n=1 Tax=Rhizodiscina lignyota TaxID=1504668 RepID=A0A9P4IKY5_9PEZI|nr:hypothetical protein NA57DRAFT_36768 [Rhizodiscina lignyota]
MTLDNDTRGWIMTLASGIACVLGSSIICVDVFVRMIPGQKDFRIQDSNGFLSSSLSLSFGVMLFSSLYSMLPSAKRSLEKGGFSSQEAAWILILCFIAGVVGIQIISRVLHHYMPSHVVDCDHTHQGGEEQSGVHSGHARPHRHSHGERRASDLSTHTDPEMAMRESAESLRQNGSYSGTDANGALARRPSLPYQLTKQVSQLMTRTKSSCDVDGQCYGYSEPCGLECFKIVQSRGGTRLPSTGAIRHPGLSRSATTSRAVARTDAHSEGTAETEFDEGDDDLAHDHHHHVPTNAFLSIGLQTSIAIALHKLPEGFITYATNHANPQLGLSVFMALFIHNITEGFAMALPLYLAINSRWKAMFWSALLGGASQPLGAGVAALWFRLARRGDSEPGEGVYGGMFAVTAGIMASVALQLFSESLDLTHNRNLCMAFAFVGMGILGISSALTA